LQPGRQRQIVTAALVLGTFLAALEATAVGTAMPTVVGELGGVSRYSWVFSAYLLTSTTTVPLYGKLADIYGRLRIYLVAAFLFLLGSILSGAARTLDELIIFRALQGLGAGGVMPISITLIGDIFTLEERGRMQGLFASVWGVSSLAGPALGGFITDLLSWRWVFYLNLPFGIASSVLLWIFLREERRPREHRLDLLGTVTLTLAVTLLILALLEGSDNWGWGDPRTIGCFSGALVMLLLFFRQETRAPEPMLPLDLFREPIIAVGSAGAAVIGMLLFAASAYVPVYAQGVLGGTAVDAGLTLAPVSIGWPLASTFAGRMLLRVGYRPLVIAGGGTALAGSALLALVDAGSGRVHLMVAMLVLGCGLGLMATPYLVAVQNAVPWNRRGVATSSQQFFRTIGGTIAIAVLGAVMNGRLAALLGTQVDPNAALDQETRNLLSAEELARLVAGLATSLRLVFLIFLFIAAAGLVIALYFPRGSAQAHAHSGASNR
jgi:EmrB/QacA subfamily drug resistance transporter